MIVQPDGKILAAGGGELGSGHVPHSVLFRYNADATLDSDFAQIIDSAFISNINDMGLQPDGKIVVGGAPGSDSASRSGSILARFNADGSIDQGFAATYLSGGNPKVVVQASGRILVNTSNSQGVTVNAYNPDGSIDTTFGNLGQVVALPRIDGDLFDIHINFYHNAMAVQPDDKIVLLGNSYPSTIPYLARLNPDGSRDTGFGSGGLVTDSSLPGMGAMTLQADGKIVIAGTWPLDIPKHSAFVLARFNADGSKDQNWANTNKGTPQARVITKVSSFRFYPTDDTLGAITVDRNGKIIAAGTVNADSRSYVIVARYNP